MGDRANICVENKLGYGAGLDRVYLYTHWHGTELPSVLQEALKFAKKENRWDDGSYLARIIFSRMIMDDVLGSTGYGISSTLGDGDNRVIFVNVADQEVRIGNKTYSFVEYCDMDKSLIWYDNG
jgi:hypothetical protein